MTRLSRLKLLERICNLGLNPDAAQPLARVIPDIPDLFSRICRLELSLRLCNCILNPDAAQPLNRFMSRLSRPYDKTSKTQTLGATLQFVSESGCCAALGAIHVQTFQTV